MCCQLQLHQKIGLAEFPWKSPGVGPNSVSLCRDAAGTLLQCRGLEPDPALVQSQLLLLF